MAKSARRSSSRSTSRSSSRSRSSSGSKATVDKLAKAAMSKEMLDQACEAVVKVASVTQPDGADVRVLNDRYAVYRRIYPALQAIFAMRQ